MSMFQWVKRQLVSDSEIFEILKVVFPCNVNSGDPREGRTLVTFHYRLFNVCTLTLEDCFDSPVVEILYPSGQSEGVCDIGGKPPVSDALNPSIYDKVSTAFHS